EAQRRRERAAREVRQRWEAEYERVDLEAEEVRRKALEDARAREADQVRSRFGDGEEDAAQRALSALRERWMHEDDQAQRERHKRGKPDLEAQRQRWDAEERRALEEALEGRAEAAEALRQRWETAYEQAEQQAQARAAQEAEELRRRWETEYEQAQREARA